MAGTSRETRGARKLPDPKEGSSRFPAYALGASPLHGYSLSTKYTLVKYVTDGEAGDLSPAHSTLSGDVEVVTSHVPDPPALGVAQIVEPTPAVEG